MTVHGPVLTVHGPVLTVHGPVLTFLRITEKYWEIHYFSWLFWNSEKFTTFLDFSWLFWNSEKFTTFLSFPLIFPNSGLWDPSEEYPDPCHGDPPRYAPCTRTHYPGTPPPCTTTAHVRVAGCTACSDGYPRFAKLLWSIVNTLIQHIRVVPRVPKQSLITRVLRQNRHFGPGKRADSEKSDHFSKISEKVLI